MEEGILFCLVFIIGYLGSMLVQRWVYYKKTGEHLQDVQKKVKQ